jgi:hypothetical protein
MFYHQLQQLFCDQIHAHHLADQPVNIAARILSNEEALGNPSRDDYPLLKGKEFLMEACCLGTKGQAFTDAPSCQNSTLAAIAHIDLDSTPNRALFVATINAVQRYLDASVKTIHCHNDQPELCAEQMMRHIEGMNADKIGLVGLQPAILEALVKLRGADNICCLDRDTSLLGSNKYGVAIQWGDEEQTRKMFIGCDLVLATGSTVVNGSLPVLLDGARKHNCAIIFYGTTVAGTARLMGLKHLCFEAE